MVGQLSTALATTRQNAIITAIDAGSGPGTLEIATTSFASILVTVAFDDPSGTVSGRVLTFSGLPNTATVANTGTAAIARIKDSDGTVIINNITVGTSGAELNLSSLSLVAGETISLNTGTITHP